MALEVASVAGPSTTTALAANTTYTSGTMLCRGFARVTVLAFADQAGTLDVDQSGDGTNWDYTTTVAVSASTGVAESVELVASYVRIRYVNGATIQGTFRLFTLLRGI